MVQQNSLSCGLYSIATRYGSALGLFPGSPDCCSVEMSEGVSLPIDSWQVFAFLGPESTCQLIQTGMNKEV